MLIVRNLSKSYKTGEPILRDVSFELNRGEMAVLTGPSGAGKSTILKMIYREEHPDGGEIKLDQYNVTAIKPRQIPKLRRHLGVVFQDFKLLPETNRLGKCRAGCWKLRVNRGGRYHRG